MSVEALDVDRGARALHRAANGGSRSSTAPVARSARTR